MSLLFRSSQMAAEQIPSRGGVGWGGAKRVTSQDAMRHSVVWGATRLRADVLSMMPVDVFRHVASEGLDVEVPKPPVLVSPASHGDGHPMYIEEWLYSTQVDLDRTGNTIGRIVDRDALRFPKTIQPVAADSVGVTVRDGRIIKYRFGNEDVQPADVWHERQFTVPGFPLGLSPIAHAALTLTTGVSALEFAHEWFSNGAIPSAVLRNTEKTIDGVAARVAKKLFKASVTSGEPFVTGKDWEYTTVQAKAAESGWIQQMQFTAVDLCRFMGVPADMIDVEAPTGRLTYANVTQRNLAFLVQHLGPAVNRREKALSRGLLPTPRFMKLNRSALLAMDDETRAKNFETQVRSRTRAPSETRALDNLPPFTAAQLEEFKVLFGTPRQTNPAAEPQPTGGTP